MHQNPRMQNWNIQPSPKVTQSEQEDEEFLRFEEDEESEIEDPVMKQLKKAKGNFTLRTLTESRER
jgi:hypothetical protein